MQVLRIALRIGIEPARAVGQHGQILGMRLRESRPVVAKRVSVVRLDAAAEALPLQPDSFALGPAATPLRSSISNGSSHGKSVSRWQQCCGNRTSPATSVARPTQGPVLPTGPLTASPGSSRALQVVDETGSRVGGRSAWLHAFVSPRETCYVIDPTRSHKPAEQLLGLDWSGTLVHDGWSVYDRFTRAFHQQCVRHLQRRCQELLETAVRGARALPVRCWR